MEYYKDLTKPQIARSWFSLWHERLDESVEHKHRYLISNGKKKTIGEPYIPNEIFVQINLYCELK